MTEQEPEFSYPVIRGENVILNVVEAEAFNSAVAEGQGFDLSLEIDGFIAGPIYGGSIEISHYSSGYKTMEGSILFTKPSGIARNWQPEIFEEIVLDRVRRIRPDLIHDEFIQLDHENFAGYFRIGEDDFVRIHLASSISGCSIELELEDRAKLEDVIGRAIPYNPANESELYELYRKFSETWLEMVDIVTNHYGSGRTYSEDTKRELGFSNIEMRAKTATAIQRSPMPPPLPGTAQTLEQPTVLEPEKPKNNLNFDSIAGLREFKKELLQRIQILQNPESAKRANIFVRSFILSAPPGTGKSKLIDAFVNEISAYVYTVKSTDIITKYFGESAQNVIKAFDEAKKMSEHGIVVMKFDEIEAIVGKTPYTYYTDIIKALNNEIDDINKNYANKIILVGATNVGIDQLEDAIVRSGRLDVLSTSYPTEDERADIWSMLLLEKYDSLVDSDLDTVNETVGLDDIDVFALAKLTEYKTGADIEKIIQNASGVKFQKSINNNGALEPITQQDLVFEINRFHRS
jgi:hypothetical protein